MGSTVLNQSPDTLKRKFDTLQARSDVAALLDITDYQLRYHLYIYSRDKAYKSFKISKKAGGKRHILAPQTSLKIIQRKLNQVLGSVYQPKPSTHGFVYEKSIVTNAKVHLRKRYVFNIDLKDFFSSINFGRVRGLLMAQPYNCNQEIATILAQICCHENQLPQGAPTSPTISNMICAKLDSQLQRLAKKNQCTYTRYADDITFSTSKAKFPPHLAYFSFEAEQLQVGNELRSIIEDNGFLINTSKVRLQTRYEHQEVTGITVNEKLNIKRKYIRNVRAMLHAWEKFGLEKAEATFWEKDQKHRFKVGPDAFRQIVRGRIEFIGSVRGKNDQIYLKLLQWLGKLAPDLVKETCLENSDASEGFAQSESIVKKCTIWTEGKTDIRHLKAAHSWLIESGKKYDVEIKFKDDLDPKKQGDKELLAMCKQYSKEYQNFPIIAIFDRDDPKCIREAHDESKGFKDWGKGVYSFALPEPSHREGIAVCIELFYKDEEIKRKDEFGRRIFLSTEFNLRTGRHYDAPNIITREHLKKDNLKIIDEKVFDINDQNVALSKDKFSSYIFDKKENFHNFDFSEFDAVFQTIENIMKHYSENNPRV